MRNVWHMNIIGSQTDAESYLEYTCLEESLQANLAYCPLVFNVQTGCNQRKAIENQLFSRGEYYYFMDVSALSSHPSQSHQREFIENMTSFFAENGIFIQRPAGIDSSEAEVWNLFLRQCMKIDRAPNIYVILEGFSTKNPLFNDFLWKFIQLCARWLHFILLMAQPLSADDQALPLFRQATCITFQNFLLSTKKAKNYLKRFGFEISDHVLNTIWSATAGWALPSDLLWQKAKRDPSILDDIQKRPLNSILYLPELYNFFQSSLIEQMSEEEIDVLLKSSVDNHLSEESCAYLGITENPSLIAGVVEKCPYITCINVFEKIYSVNPVAQSFLYHTATQKFGEQAMLALHTKAAEYYKGKGDWKRVLSHNILQGKIREAAYAFRFLAFEVISSYLNEGYKELVRRAQLSTLENDPWVQFAYAITIKYQYPDISLQYFDKALCGFFENNDVDGAVLAFCQKVCLGFFSESHKTIVLNQEMLTRFQTKAGTRMCDDVVLDNYRKIFLAYAHIQLGENIESASQWLNEAAQAGVILQDCNLRLWTDFVRILHYANRPDSQQLKFYVSQALELAEMETENIHPELKMYLYQTVAFVFFIKSGLYEKARAYCEEARILAHNIGASSYVVYINLIYTYALDCLREFELAEQIIPETENTARNILNVKNEHLWAYYMIGQAYHYYLKGDDWQAAFYAADNAISLSRRSKRNSYLARALLVMSSIQTEHGDLRRAMECIEECIAITASKKYFFYQVSALYQQAVIHDRSGNHALAASELRHVLEQARKADIFHFNFTAPWDLPREIEAIDPSLGMTAYVRDLCARNSSMQERSSFISAQSSKKSYYFRLFGSFHCYRGETDLTMFVPQKSRSLLEMLAVSSEPIGIARVIEAFWPHQSQKQAMNSFYFALHQIRKGLENKDFIRYEQKRCWLDKDFFSTDVQEFFLLEKRGEDAKAQGDPESCLAFYEKASELYRGPFLEEEYLEDFLESEKHTIERRAYLFFLRYGSLLLQSGNARKCLEVLQKVLRNEFSQEEVYRMLMTAYYILGNRSEALRIYQELERKLIQEIDVTPHFITRQIYESIKSGESPSIVLKHLEEGPSESSGSFFA